MQHADLGIMPTTHLPDGHGTLVLQHDELEACTCICMTALECLHDCVCTAPVSNMQGLQGLPGSQGL